ncbi:ATP/GTP-binding protein [Paenarthrobacter sp. CCNWLY172]|uniref:ATP/GTP-binding protein n=1 Tax=unclassified Paenarthrobacter TaxID=2634190 RepID=UPI0030777254
MNFRSLFTKNDDALEVAPQLPDVERIRKAGRRAYIAPSKRGYAVPGGGHASYIDLPAEYRGSSRQVCGLYPFSSGAGSPLAGVPLGSNLLTGNIVGLDHFTAYQRGLIPNPSAYFMSNPALGKSTLVGKIMMGLDAFGVLSMTLGDVKGEHVLRTRMMGGKVIRLGNDRGYLNVLDSHIAMRAAERLTGGARQEVLTEAHYHRKSLLMALLTIARGSSITEEETIVLDKALRILFDRFDGVPLIKDLAQVIADRPEAIRNAVLDRGEDERYANSTDALQKSLNGIADGSTIGGMFSRHTRKEDQMDITRSCVFDLSAIDDTLPEQQAAAMLASWSTGFAAVKVSQVLADAGLEPRRNYNIVLDELWRALRIGRGIVDRADSLTRLNRHQGIGQMMISHTLKDFDAVADEADRKKAQGFAERCSMIVMGGLGRSEMDAVQNLRNMTRAERQRIVSWSDSKKITSRGGKQAPYGRGKFLIKLGQGPGIPVETRLTSVEDRVADTNQRWEALRKEGLTPEEIERQLGITDADVEETDHDAAA